MASFMSFVLIYLLGGLTFIPLLVLAVLLHAHFTFPVRDVTPPTDDNGESILRSGDDETSIKSADKALADSLQRRPSGDADVAAGYFAVCREFVPGGVKGKPPERTTPSGSTTVVASQSPSVYQSMYRSIFDRKTTASPFDNKSAGKPPRKGGNVFYVVLRHGHLMLYDDDEMVEVRYVISLAHHRVSIYGGGEALPEGELFIKRNAICLSRSIDSVEAMREGTVPKPFYLFSENCSDKEDFYFALLRNQERKPDSIENPPTPLHYDIKHIISLVQRLHSSEEHLQTRWINALLGRLFLALYKTSDVESFLRAKITKKISRVKTPSFLSGIVLQKIAMGEGAPYVTNPRLKDLTVDGECVVEADVRYTGNFHIEVAATARIELGARFKAREVNLVLAAILKKLEGHLLIRVKPPPSNRLWISFEKPPHMELQIEPIVSSRQITYGIILRQIESRIKEVVAETLVLPNWDDTPFFHTEGKQWRGGVWADSTHTAPSDVKTAAAEEGDVDELHNLESPDAHDAPIEATPTDVPELQSRPSSLFSRRGAKSAANLSTSKSNASSSSVDTKASISEKPRVMRSGSFANASSPVVATDNTNADVFKPASPPDQSFAASAMAAMAARSRNNSQSNSPAVTPTAHSKANSLSETDLTEFKPDAPISTPTKSKSVSSASSGGSGTEAAELGTVDDAPTQSSDGTSRNTPENSVPPSPASASMTSVISDSAKSFSSDGRRESSASSTGSVKSGNGVDKRLSLTAMTNAAISAKNWGLGQLARQGTLNKDKGHGSGVNLNEPMGRGRPLPPPGMPLPPPDRRTKTAPIPVPKRKPLPPPMLPQRSEQQQQQTQAPEKSKSISIPATQRRPVPPPPLPKRPSGAQANDHADADGMLVVAAPADSEPTTPLDERSPRPYVQPWAEEGEMEDEIADNAGEGEEEEENPHDTSQGADEEKEEDDLMFDPSEASPRRPKSRRATANLSDSPEDEYRTLPTWMVAQEEEARGKSVWVDDDTGAS